MRGKYASKSAIKDVKISDKFSNFRQKFFESRNFLSPKVSYYYYYYIKIDNINNTGIIMYYILIIFSVYDISVEIRSLISFRFFIIRKFPILGV